MPAWRPILGLHFPRRSFAQFERKVIKDGEAVANNPDPRIAMGVWRELYQLHRTGGLADLYARDVLDDAQVRDGIRQGRLATDERLKTFFAVRTESVVATPTPVDPDRVERLGIDLRRAAHEAECHPLAVDVRDLAKRLKTAERQLEKTARGLEKSQRRLERSEGRRVKAERMLVELKEALRLAKHREAERAEAPRGAWRAVRRAVRQRPNPAVDGS